MKTAKEALELLRQGQQRFASGNQQSYQMSSAERRTEVASEQNPFALILCCSDSRVPPEIVFDRGIGDLFIVRVAGNSASALSLATVELAIDLIGIRLIVVLGHTDCKAVATTLAHLGTADEATSQADAPLRPNLTAMLDLIAPGLQSGMTENGLPNLDEAIRRNISAMAIALPERSELVRYKLDKEGLAIVGALYSVETGKVSFLDSVGTTLEIPANESS